MVNAVPVAIEENAWQRIEYLFLTSPATRDLVKAGKLKVVGAIYKIGSGQVSWMPRGRVDEILAGVEKNPQRAMEAMAGGH